MPTLSLSEKYAKLNFEQTKTKNEAYEKMNTFGKVMIVRPTGFGKTKTIVEIGKEYATKYKKKKVAYIYPLDIIKVEIQTNSNYMSDGIIKKSFDFISYMELTTKLNKNGSMYWRERFEKDNSLLIIDESHGAGSEGFQNLYSTIEDIIKGDGLHMVGATATPDRMSDTTEFNVFENIFGGIGVYEYTLADCFKDGLIPQMIYPMPTYNIKELVEDLKATSKKKCKEAGTEFDEGTFNVEIGKLLKDTGTGSEAEYIYNALPQAGYNLKSQNNKYFKFIVFFINKEDMVERGPVVEKWFEDAFNKVAVEREGLRQKFNVKSHYIVSTDTENNDMKALVESKSDSRSFFTQTKKVSNIERTQYTVDLLFTINKINMGYHVDGITGIMMLRGTKSEIVYMQQLGRALSVKAEYNPIVYDMVSNAKAKFWRKKEAEEREQKLREIISGGDTREASKLEGIDLVRTGYIDGFDDFISRWSDIYQSEKAKILYMYQDRKAPICVIAQETNTSCTKVAKTLNDLGIELRTEDELFNYNNKIINSDNYNKEKKQSSIRLMKYIYSKKAMEVYNKFKNTTQSVYSTIIGKIFGR